MAILTHPERYRTAPNQTVLHSTIFSFQCSSQLLQQLIDRMREDFKNYPLTNVLSSKSAADLAISILHAMVATSTPKLMCGIDCKYTNYPHSNVQ